MPENNKDQFNKTPNNNNEYNIEDEIAKSVEKMVEEETNVARATYSVNNTQIPNNQVSNNVQNGQNLNVNGQANYYNNYNYAQADMGKTQVIPDVSAHLNMNNSNTATQQYNRQPQQAGQQAYNGQPQQASQQAYNRQPQQQAGQQIYNRQPQQQGESRKSQTTTQTAGEDMAGAHRAKRLIITNMAQKTDTQPLSVHYKA